MTNETPPDLKCARLPLKVFMLVALVMWCLCGQRFSVWNTKKPHLHVTLRAEERKCLNKDVCLREENQRWHTENVTLLRANVAFQIKIYNCLFSRRCLMCLPLPQNRHPCGFNLRIKSTNTSKSHGGTSYWATRSNKDTCQWFIPPWRNSGVYLKRKVVVVASLLTWFSQVRVEAGARASAVQPKLTLC